MLIPKEHKIDFLKEHTVEYYLEIFEGTINMRDQLDMTPDEHRELLHNVIVFRMIKLIEDHCE